MPDVKEIQNSMFNISQKVHDKIEEADTHVLMNREEVLARRKKYWRFRRVQDVTISLIGLAVLWPLMLLTALLIVIDSPGAGPIYVQNRVGRDGKVFRFYKFRSMIPRADQKLEELLEYNEMTGPAFKIKDDPRITRVGRFIRKSSIDELPQIFNVLKGDMSIVGPRPPLPREVEQYGDYESQRLYVTPGLTCYWQIQPHRNELTFDEWLELDLKYITECNILDDWKIIFKTFGAVLGMHGE